MSDPVPLNLQERLTSDIDFSLEINKEYITMITVSTKRIEVRKFNKERIPWIGKTGLFFDVNGIMVLVKIYDIKHYPDLKICMDKETFRALMPTIGTYDEVANRYHQWYSDEKIKDAGGIHALHFEIVRII